MPYLYLIATPSGHAKIGITTDPQIRLKQLQTGNHEPLTLIASMDPEADRVSALDMERFIHRLKHKTKGEWFDDLPAAHRAIKLAWAKYKYPHIYTRWCRRYPSSKRPPAA